MMSLAPTAWRGSIILQDDVREMELDFLEIKNVHSAPAPIRLFGDNDSDCKETT
jgi:hypothetical protein